MRPPAGPAVPRSRRAPVRIRYAAVGLVLGGAWLWNGDLSPWVHALRLLVVVLVAFPVARWAHARYLRWRGSEAGSRPHLWGLVVAKVLLVAIALVIELALEQWLGRTAATAVAAAAILVVVAVGGPLVHERLVVGAIPSPAGP